MKILRVTTNNFKLCENNFTIDFIPKANKTEEDKEIRTLWSWHRLICL